MPLAVFRANVDFSQSSLSSEGNEACWPMSAKLFEEHLQEQMRRVLQPPSCERPLACPGILKVAGQNRPERENRQGINLSHGKKFQHAEDKTQKVTTPLIAENDLNI